MHAHNVSMNIRACDSAHARTLSRNVRSLTYNIICARASASIFAHTSACLCVCAWAYASIRAHAPQAFVLAVAVLRVCLSFFPTHFCEMTLANALGNLMLASGVLLEIPCIISRNRRNIAPCSGLVKKLA